MAIGARAAGRTDTTGLCPAMHHRHRHSEILRAWKTSENSATLKKAQKRLHQSVHQNTMMLALKRQ